MKRGTVLVGLGCVLAVAACTAFSADTSGDAGTDGGATAPEGGSDAGSDRTAPPGMVIVPGSPSFAIDAKEVTVNQYDAFVTATLDGGVTHVPTECNAKTSFQRAGSCSKTGVGDKPVNCVDWCDAQAYCAWAGKRLCGRLGDGARLLPTDVEGEWSTACAGPTGNRWPYGAAVSTLRCNTSERDAGNAAVTGSSPECTGGFPGLVDMSGNVGELIDAYDPVAQRAATRGGSFKHPGLDSNCVDYVLFEITRASEDVGFRCCKSF